MKQNLRLALLRCETDLDGALHRFAENEELYESCLSAFLEDQTIAEIDDKIDTESWDEVFTAVHAIKGLAGNMGFVPLFHSSAEMVVLIRAGRTDEINASYVEMKRCYAQITKAIQDNI